MTAAGLPVCVVADDAMAALLAIEIDGGRRSFGHWRYGDLGCGRRFVICTDPEQTRGLFFSEVRRHGRASDALYAAALARLHPIPEAR